MTIQEILDNILHAVFGKDVRQSMHDGVKRANDICEETEARQAKLETKYDLLLKNCTELSPSDSEIVDARIRGDGTIYGTLGERLNNMDAYNAELEATRNKEDGMQYETLGDRLNAMDTEIDEKMNSITASELFEELNGRLEQYLPRTGKLSLNYSESAPGISRPEPFSECSISDKLITANAKVLGIYNGAGALISEGEPPVFANEMINASGILTYADVDEGRIYLKSDDPELTEGMLALCYVIYVRDILGKDSFKT